MNFPTKTAIAPYCLGRASSELWFGLASGLAFNTALVVVGPVARVSTYPAAAADEGPTLVPSLATPFVLH